MKKVFLSVLVASVLVFSIASCSKEDEVKVPVEAKDDDKGGANTSIEGTWKYTAVNIENEYDINNDGKKSKNLVEETNCFVDAALILNKDKTSLLKDRTLKVTTEAGKNDEVIFTTECIALSDSPSTWSQKGDILTLTENEIKVTRDFKLENNKLTFTLEKMFGFKLPNGELVLEDITYILTKE